MLRLARQSLQALSRTCLAIYAVYVRSVLREEWSSGSIEVRFVQGERGASIPYHAGGSSEMNSEQGDYEKRQLEHLVEGREQDS